MLPLMLLSDNGLIARLRFREIFSVSRRYLIAGRHEDRIVNEIRKEYSQKLQKEIDVIKKKKKQQSLSLQ